jgi:threonylcarbamoyladenosine tRNA methylthiotransferase MtaB
MRSRGAEAIVDELRRLVDSGYREIVLTGIHLGHYGVDRNWRKPKSQWLRLSTLLKRLMIVPGDFRIRLSSIEATEVTRELLAVMSEFGDRICPHLHVCLQSGSDRILRHMKRRWGARRFIDRCRLAQQTLDKPALTTDVIVGFPGETDEDFRRTCQVVREVGFSKVHIFPFSARQGTPAAEMSDQITKRQKSDRGRELAALEAELRHNYFHSLQGTELHVLIESQLARDASRWVGTSCRYAPVVLSDSTCAAGELVSVKAGPVVEQMICAR